MPRIMPETSERNLIPSSTALSGPLSTVPGTVVLGQIVTEALETVMLSGFVAMFWAASVTFALKLEVPTVVGVPVMAPLALRLSPEGKAPEAIDHA
jgi:hypothetical protein